MYLYVCVRMMCTDVFSWNNNRMLRSPSDNVLFQLALIQTRIVLDLLREQHPDLKFDIGQFPPITILVSYCKYWQCYFAINWV